MLAPFFRSVTLSVSQTCWPVLASTQTNSPDDFSVDQRRRHAWRKRDLVILLQVPLPEHFAVANIKAEEVAEPSQNINLAVLDDWSRDRSDLLRWVECPVLVGDVIGVSPIRLARRFVQTVESFLGLGFHQLGIGQEDPALRHHRTGKSPTDRDTPANLQTFGREGLQQTGFIARAVAIRPAPLRPIFRAQCRGHQQRQGEDGSQECLGEAQY